MDSRADAESLANDQLGARNQQDDGEQNLQRIGREPAAADMGTNDSTKGNDDGKERDLRRQVVKAGQVTSQTGERVCEYEGDRNGGSLLYIGPTRQQQYGRQKNTAANSGQAGQQPDGGTKHERNTDR
jgi:hypothetical protein